jgi:hypothetical protein
VLVGGKHRLISVAARARPDLGGTERVRLMTAGALRVALRERGLLDLDLLSRLLRMAPRATLVGGALGLVDRMAVDATAHSCVLGLLFTVTLRARPRLERRRAMCAMAVTARLLGMRAYRVMRALISVVTAHAARRLAMRCAEPVTVLAPGRVRSGMQGRHDVGVAART